MIFDKKFLKKSILSILLYSILLCFLVFCLFPVGWMLSTSFKTYKETFSTPPHWFPHNFTFDAYLNMWKMQPLFTFIINSIIVSTITTLLSVLLASLAGYGFSRGKFRGINVLLLFTLITQMFPSIVLVVPYFIMMSRIGLFNSYPALIIAYISFSLPFCIWMQKAFIDTIPIELEQSALIDGCSQFNAFVKIVFPLSLPGIFTTILFSFLLAWTEFLFALCLTSTSEMYTITVGISSLIGQYRIYWNELMAAATVASIPTILICVFLEKYLVQGLTLGALKS